jgi:hypothetical protein
VKILGDDWFPHNNVSFLLESDWSKVAVFSNECSLQGMFPAIYLGCQATPKGALNSEKILKANTNHH